jgi:hypothetical protein
MRNPRGQASIPFTIAAGAELALLEFSPTLGRNEYLGSFNTTSVPRDPGRTLVASGLDSTGVRFRSDFSSRFLGHYDGGKQKHTQSCR